MVGMPDSNVYKSNILPNTDRWYSYDYSEQPKHARVNMFNMQAGDYVKFSIPFTGNEAFIYRDRRLNAENQLIQVNNMAAMEVSLGDIYYIENNRLYLQLQARSGFDFAAFDICTMDKCGIVQ